MPHEEPDQRAHAMDAIDHWIYSAIVRFGADPEQVMDRCEAAVEESRDEAEAQRAA